MNPIKYRAEALVGRKFGRLFVISVTHKKKYGRRYRWALCKCDCGKTKSVRIWHLLHGGCKSCGCSQGNVVHGLARRGFEKQNKSEYMLWCTAKARAKKKGIPFSIDVTDIKIPDKCPLLGLVLKRNKNKRGPNSPSLDRINPAGGYVLNNVWVISWRANRAKADLSFEELKRLVENLEKITIEKAISETR